MSRAMPNLRNFLTLSPPMFPLSTSTSSPPPSSFPPMSSLTLPTNTDDKDHVIDIDTDINNDDEDNLQHSSVPPDCATPPASPTRPRQHHHFDINDSLSQPASMPSSSRHSLSPSPFRAILDPTSSSVTPHAPRPKKRRSIPTTNKHNPTRLRVPASVRNRSPGHGRSVTSDDTENHSVTPNSQGHSNTHAIHHQQLQQRVSAMLREHRHHHHRQHHSTNTNENTDSNSNKIDRNRNNHSNNNNNALITDSNITTITASTPPLSPTSTDSNNNGNYNNNNSNNIQKGKSTVKKSSTARTHKTNDNVSKKISAPPPDEDTLSTAKTHLRYGTFGLRAGFLRQDSRPLAFLPMKAQRYARLQGTLLSLAKGPHGEVTWSFDVAGSVVETASDDRKITIYIVDSQRRKRRVMVLSLPDGKSFLMWSLWLSRASKSVLEMHYSMDKLISKGAFARVVLGNDKHTGEPVAIKLIEKSNAPPSERKYFEREVKIMQTLSHEHIVRCYDIFDSRLRTRIVMEFMEGGTLGDLIARHAGNAIPEMIVKRLMRDVLAGVKYLHANGTIHRDLKPDNCLLSRRKAPYGPVKIADFGLASMVERVRTNRSNNNLSNGCLNNGSNSQSEMNGVSNSGGNVTATNETETEQGVLSSAVGSPAFVAPEIFESRYGTAVDIWSCGVILYMMLSGGVMPFHGKTTSEMISHARKGIIDFTVKPVRNASENAKGLLRGLLNSDGQERLTAKQALAHGWFKEVGNASGEASSSTSRSKTR